LGTSPMIAPTVGGYVTDSFGWQTIFVILGIMGICLLMAVRFILPVSYQADPGYSLKPAPIIRNFMLVLSERQFLTYALAGATAFAGLFVYVSGSPQVFMEIYRLDGKMFGWIFAGLSVGFIGAGQISTLLLKKFSSQQIVYTSLLCQAISAVIFLGLSVNHLMDMYATIFFIFIFLFCLGLVIPNTSALALAPFETNAGSASSLLGVFQMTIGAMASTGISLFHARTTTPMILIMTIASLTALIILMIGRRKMANAVSL
ncbi:MAG: MFS transporter, partial [Sphingobacteriales bacterium]